MSQILYTEDISKGLILLVFQKNKVATTLQILNYAYIAF